MQRSKFLDELSAVLLGILILAALAAGLLAIVALLSGGWLARISAIVLLLPIIGLISSAGLWAVGAFSNNYTQSVNGKRGFLISGTAEIVAILIVAIAAQFKSVWVIIGIVSVFGLSICAQVIVSLMKVIRSKATQRDQQTLDETSTRFEISAQTLEEVMLPENEPIRILQNA
jgi:hypothetical protein